MRLREKGLFEKAMNNIKMCTDLLMHGDIAQKDMRPFATDSNASDRPYRFCLTWSEPVLSHAKVASKTMSAVDRNRIERVTYVAVTV